MRSYYQKVVVGRERQGKSSRNNLFFKKFEETGCLTRRPGSGRPSKATTEIKGNRGAPNAQGQHDYGSSTALYTGGLQIQHYLKNCSPLPHCSRVDLLWQCVLPTDSRDKDKHLAWAQAHLHETFDNITWTDECTIQLETHRHFCCRKQGEPPRPKLRYSTFHVGDYYVIYLYVHVIHSILLPCK